MPKIPNDGRLEEVLEMWRTGMPTRRIQVDISHKYHISNRQVRKYIRKVEQVMAARQAEEAPSMRAKALAILEAFHERAVDAGDLKAQGVAVDRICRMAGLLAPTVVNLQGSLTANVTLTDEQEAARLAELRERQDGKKP